MRLEDTSRRQLQGRGYSPTCMYDDGHWNRQEKPLHTSYNDGMKTCLLAFKLPVLKSLDA